MGKFWGLRQVCIHGFQTIIHSKVSPSFILQSCVCMCASTFQRKLRGHARGGHLSPRATPLSAGERKGKRWSDGLCWHDNVHVMNSCVPGSITHPSLLEDREKRWISFMLKMNGWSGHPDKVRRTSWWLAGSVLKNIRNSLLPLWLVIKWLVYWPTVLYASPGSC